MTRRAGAILCRRAAAAGTTPVAAVVGMVAALLLLGGCSQSARDPDRASGDAGGGRAAAAEVVPAAPTRPRAPSGGSGPEARKPPAAPAAAAREPTSTPPASATPEAQVAEATPAPLRSQPDVPLAPMGRPAVRSALEGLPGYVPPEQRDAEFDAVARGRRRVGPIDAEFTRAYDSAEELARAVLDGIESNVPDTLYHLVVTEAEYEKILWPEFPESRPATNIQAADAWFFHTNHCREGVNNALEEWGGSTLTFDHLSYTVGLAPYTNFNLYHGVEIHARTAGNEEVILTFAPIFVERNGKWKVYIYKD